jgi:hypothetical protein
MTKKPTIEELENKILLNEKLDGERSISDKKYARKEVEKILIWVGGIILAAVIMAAMSVVLK